LFADVSGLNVGPTFKRRAATANSKTPKNSFTPWRNLKSRKMQTYLITQSASRFLLNVGNHSQNDAE